MDNRWVGVVPGKGSIITVDSRVAIHREEEDMERIQLVELVSYVIEHSCVRFTLQGQQQDQSN